MDSLVKAAVLIRCSKKEIEHLLGKKGGCPFSSPKYGGYS